jgi:hypothetical protein
MKVRTAVDAGILANITGTFSMTKKYILVWTTYSFVLQHFSLYFADLFLFISPSFDLPCCISNHQSILQFSRFVT